MKVPHIGAPLRTKLEFSRRDAIAEVAFEAVDAEVLRPYGVAQVLATHYTAGAAIAQKIRALAGRREPQARDVFDLQLLLARPEARELSSGVLPASLRQDALEHARGLSFDQYRSQVVAYLDPAQAAPYGKQAAWAAMQEAVVERLRRGR